MPPSTVFTKFPELPTELRRKIWAFASRQPRSIELMYAWVDREFLNLKHPPAVLHACFESREVALYFYTLSFGTQNHPPKIYFNPVEDIVYFGSRQFDDEIVFTLEYFRDHVESLVPGDKIQRIAVAASHWRRRGSPLAFSRRSRKIRRFLSSFPNIEQLIFVKEQEKKAAEVDEPKESAEDCTEDHTEDIIENLSQNYSGLSLVKCPELAMESLHDCALDAVLSTFTAQKNLHNGLDFLEVIVMEYSTG